MNVTNALKSGAERLKQSDSADLDAEILLGFVLNQSKEFLHTQAETKLNWIQKIRFFYLISQRSKNWPVAYLTGVKEFYGRNFFVNKNVLTPRPLTEELIDRSLKFINETKSKNFETEGHYSIADIGTGSGNIIITVIKELQKQNYDLAKFKFYAIDLSKKALKVAKTNARRHGVEKYLNFNHGDLLKPLQGLKIDLILANLPYLDTNDLAEPSIKKEPKLALLGTYDEFFKQADQFTPRPTIIYEDKLGIHLYKK